MAARGGRDAKGGIAAKGGRDAKGGNGRQGTVGQTHHLAAPAAFCRPLAALIVSESRLDCRGCPSGGPDLRSASRRGCSSAGRAPGSHPGGQGFEPPQLHEDESLLPVGVTGNTPDSGSGESWFDPRRGNLKGRRQKRRRPFRSAPPAHYLLTSSKYNPFKTASSMQSEMPSLSSSVSAAFLMPSLSWSSSWSSRMPSLSSSLS